MASACWSAFRFLPCCLYLALGRPDMPDAPLAARLAGPVENLPPEAVRARLEAELRARPNDAQGWRLLARLRQGVGDHAKAADAWQRLIALGATDAESLTGLAVALIEQDGGVVSSAAFELLQPRPCRRARKFASRFLVCNCLAPTRGIDEARAAFIALRANLPDGLPLAAMLEREIEALNLNLEFCACFRRAINLKAGCGFMDVFILGI